MFSPYQDKDSRIHRLDARPKMVFVLALFLLSILISSIFYLAVLFAFVMCVVVAGKVLKATLSILRYTIFVAIFLFPFSILFGSGSHVLFSIGPVQVKEEAILFAVSMTFRLFLAVSAFAILTFTVHPDQSLRIMSKFGFKSMTGLSIATRMYPTIAADSGNIEDAMKARGVEFDQGNIIQKAKVRAPVMMPLLLNSMDRSMEIAEAMEARGFGAGVRTHYFDTPLSTRDKAMIALFLAAIPFGVAMFILGYGSADYMGGSRFVVQTVDLLVVSIEVLFFAPILIGGPR
ncbi:MAG: energy-coupling factor transporter transmembrane component T [Methanomassiliicoccales archaeon]|nr:energy-coupling factor transporter transmembrane component T [Methanomassiliicoccales archaeon]